jgi:hypothetical protein
VLAVARLGDRCLLTSSSSPRTSEQADRAHRPNPRAPSSGEWHDVGHSSEPLLVLVGSGGRVDRSGLNED